MSIETVLGNTLIKGKLIQLGGVLNLMALGISRSISNNILGNLLHFWGLHASLKEHFLRLVDLYSLHRFTPMINFDRLDPRLLEVFSLSIRQDTQLFNKTVEHPQWAYNFNNLRFAC